MRIELGNENNPAICECCGNKTKTVWGYAYENEVALAAYFVQWTHAKPDHSPNFDFLIGTWGNNQGESMNAHYFAIATPTPASNTISK